MTHRLLEAPGIRRRLAGSVLVLAAVVVGAQVWSYLPRQSDLEIALGQEHRRIVRVRISYLFQGEEIRGVDLRFPGGAPAVVRHRVDLSPGTYRMEIELLQDDGQAQTVKRTLRSPARGTVRIPAP